MLSPLGICRLGSRLQDLGAAYLMYSNTLTTFLTP